MDTNSKQVPSSWALPEVCLSVLCPFFKKKQAWPLVHTYPLYHRKRALWSGIRLHWSICWRDNLQRRMPFFLLTVENDLTFNDFVLCNQTCDNLAADTTKAWEAGFLNGMDYRIRTALIYCCIVPGGALGNNGLKLELVVFKCRVIIWSTKVWNCHLLWLPEFLMKCLLSWPWNSKRASVWAFEHSWLSQHNNTSAHNFPVWGSSFTFDLWTLLI